MAFTFPADLPEDWVDDIGMIEDADFLNHVGDLGNALKAAILAIVNGADSAFVATAESTSSASYTDLTTTTDSVTATIGSSGKALVFLRAQASGAASAKAMFMSFALSGANTVAASDAFSCNNQGASALTPDSSISAMFLLKNLAAGSTTFKAKYRTTAGIANFYNRHFAVIPFP